MLTILTHSDCQLHMIAGHKESPERLEAINKVLSSYPYLEAPLATQEQLLLAHNRDYVEYIFSHSPQDSNFVLDPDTSMNPYSLNAALRAAGAVIKAVDLVMTGKNQQVFCNIRPPGHHAEKHQAMGFCIFNNVAIAAKYALTKYELQRVAIVDFDVHHGNGTQDILKDDSRVMFCSLYEHPIYPYNEVTTEHPRIFHLPLPAYSTYFDLKKSLSNLWLKPLRDFQPELLIFSAGFDAHRQDEISTLAFESRDYFDLTREIIEATKISTHGRVISSLEGGYHIAALAESVFEHARALDHGCAT